MMFKYNKQVFTVPYHNDDILRLVAILEFVWPGTGVVTLPGKLLYMPFAWQRDNLVGCDYKNYIRTHELQIRTLLNEIRPL